MTSPHVTQHPKLQFQNAQGTDTHGRKTLMYVKSEVLENSKKKFKIQNNKMNGITSTGEKHLFPTSSAKTGGGGGWGSQR